MKRCARRNWARAIRRLVRRALALPRARGILPDWKWPGLTPTVNAA